MRTRKDRSFLAAHTFPKVSLIQPAFLLLFGNGLDIYTTLQNLLVGNIEGNPFPAHLIRVYGWMGFALYKTSIVLSVVGMVFLSAWLIGKARGKPEDVYLVRRFSHFGLWLAVACYIPVVANNLAMFYIKVHGSSM